MSILLDSHVSIAVSWVASFVAEIDGFCLAPELDADFKESIIFRRSDEEKPELVCELS